jgi:hypothetical protein
MILDMLAFKTQHYSFALRYTRRGADVVGVDVVELSGHARLV